MERIELAKGLEISRVVTGLWQVADLERSGATLDPKVGADELKQYAEAGFTAFDMADHYGSAEVLAGACRSNHPETRLECLTKWVPEAGPQSRDGVRAAVERALERLNAERIDLLQFHSWNYADLSYLDCLTWLQELREEGMIAHLGLTNFDTPHLRVVTQSGIEIASNQICYSLLDRRAGNDMGAFCQQHGISLLAYGTLAGGFLTERFLGRDEPGGSELTTWSQMKYKRFVNASGGWPALQSVLSALERIARRHSVSMANVACRYVLEQPAVKAIIIGARIGERRHIEENQRLFEFQLANADKRELEEVLQSLRPLPGDCGDEYRKPPFLTASGDLSHHLNAMPAAYDPVGRDRQHVFSSTEWESLAGYSRAVRVGDRVVVSGTTATHGSKLIGGEDPAAQAHFVIDKIEAALQSLGSRLQDVIRTRVFVQRMDDWEAVARAHGQRFHEIDPANTLVRADLVGDRHLVEIEAEAIVQGEGQ